MCSLALVRFGRAQRVDRLRVESLRHPLLVILFKRDVSNIKVYSLLENTGPL